MAKLIRAGKPADLSNKKKSKKGFPVPLITCYDILTNKDCEAPTAVVTKHDNSSEFINDI